MFLAVAIIVVQLPSHVWLFTTPWTEVHQASVCHRLQEFAQTHVHWVGDANGARAHRSTINNSQSSLNENNLNVHWRMDEEDVVHVHNGMLLNG